jgi:hypothetical protein
MGIVEPEVKRYDSGLNKKAAQDKNKCGNDKAIYRRLEHSADLSQVEGAGPAVEKRRAA